MRVIDVTGTYDLTVNWTRNFVVKTGCDGVVIGLSGGIDSSLVAAICVDALGKENVYGMILPAIGSDPKSEEDALTVAKFLDIQHEAVCLAGVLDSFSNYFDLGEHRIAHANLKSRLRMCTLYYRANQKNYLVAGTTNLAEMFIGYFTKYGDGGIDFEPIAGLLKREVRSLATHRGLPKSVIEKSPSADLWPGQTDESELGLTYDQIDEAIDNIRNNKTAAQIADMDDSTDAEKAVMKLMVSTTHKRNTPPSNQQVILATGE